MQAGARAADQMNAIGQLAEHRDGSSGGATRLGDATVVFVVLRQAVRGIGGVTSLAVIVIALGVLVRALDRIAARALRRLRPPRPSRVGLIILITMAGEPLRRIAGARAAGTPSTSPVIALSLLVLAFRRIVPSAVIVGAAFRAVRHALSLDPPPK
jgi:hypothetical protein